MGTRNLICVVKDKEFRLTKYCQWDGYLKGQGNDIVNIIIKLNTQRNWEKFRKHVDGLVCLSESEITKRWAEFGAANNDGFVSLEASKQFFKKYPSLHRDTGADILNLILNNENLEVAKADPGFAYNVGWVGCEYCYVLDLDNDSLEIYSYRKGTKDGRFKDGIKLFSEIPFNEVNENTILYLVKAHN